MHSEVEPVFECPFCDLTTSFTPESTSMRMLCCHEASEVINAVLDYVETKQQIEVVDRVMERLERMRNSALVN